VIDTPQSPSPPFSEWIVYVDESGDHGIASIDPSYPIFVLVFVWASHGCGRQSPRQGTALRSRANFRGGQLELHDLIGAGYPQAHAKDLDAADAE
jgi:hypothetical protein